MRQLIIGGTPVEHGRYPYFALLNDYCGAALIAPDIAIAAGHCLSNEKIELKIGIVWRNETHKEKRFVLTQIQHPDYACMGNDDHIHDFLIMQLDKPSSLPIVRLNGNPKIPYIGQEVIAMGMGDTHRYYDSLSDVLNAVRLNAISNNQCEQSQRRGHSYMDRITPSMLCTTGGPNNERDACDYDSGSPIVVPGERYDLLVALVSWGERCADPDFPGVNARISSGYEWIRETVCDVSESPPAYLNCGQEQQPPISGLILLPITFVVGTILMVSWQLIYRLRKQKVKLAPHETESLAAPSRYVVKKESYDSVGIEVT